MANYGDVVLNLPPDWSRTRVAGNPSFVLTTVGHENGTSDAYLTDKPDLRHQFKWIDPKDQTDMSVLRTKHFNLCTKKDWTKNPALWEWSGEDNIIHNGQLLMARDASYWYAEQEENSRTEQDRNRKRAMSQEEERGLQKLERRGVTIEDERGRQLKPLSKQK